MKSTSTPKLLGPLLATTLAAACGDDGSATDDTSSTTEVGTSAASTSSGAEGPEPTTAVDSTSTAAPDDTTTAAPTTGDPSDTSDSGDDTTTGAACDTAVIEIDTPQFHPEGLDIDARGNLYVASLTLHQILHVDPCGDGGQPLIETFVDDPALIGAVGVLVDEESGVLWVCNSDFFGGTPPAIVGYDLDDGQRVAEHAFDFGFCNDLVLDGDGNLFATDSLGARIVRVAADDRLSDAPVEVWSADPLFFAGPMAFTLNGIALEGDAAWVVSSGTAQLFRVPVLASGDAGPAEAVAIDGDPFMVPDGLRRRAPGELVLVDNAAAQVRGLELTQDGATATVLVDGLDFPTTGIVDGDALWIVESQLDHLQDPDTFGPPELPFVVVRVVP